MSALPNVKVLGLVGGIGPASTIEYYRLILADRLRLQAGIQGLILGGTELPLLLSEENHYDLPLLDTTRRMCRQSPRRPGIES